MLFLTGLVCTFFGDNCSFWLSAWPFTQSTIYMLYFHAKKEFQDIFQHIFFVWCKQLQVLTVLMEKDHVSSHSQGSGHHCCVPPPKCQLFTNNSGAVFGSAAIHFWHIQWIKKKVALHLNWKHETFLTSQQQYCISDGPANKPAMGAFHAFPNQTKQKAIICVLPQGGHLTENNRWLLRSSLVFLYRDCTIYTVTFTWALNPCNYYLLIIIAFNVSITTADGDWQCLGVCSVS